MPSRTSNPWNRLAESRAFVLLVGVLRRVALSAGAGSPESPALHRPALTPHTPEEETIVPTFETQKLARTYILDIPAPRGQITDRNGLPLAQNKLSYNLAITFPTPLDFSDAQALKFAREKIERRRNCSDAPSKSPMT